VDGFNLAKRRSGIVSGVMLEQGGKRKLVNVLFEIFSLEIVENRGFAIARGAGFYD
jgi:hypothetical protein